RVRSEGRGATSRHDRRAMIKASASSRSWSAAGRRSHRQVERFFPMTRPCEIRAGGEQQVKLAVSWPDIPFEEFHKRMLGEAIVLILLYFCHHRPVNGFPYATYGDRGTPVRRATLPSSPTAQPM